MLFQNLSKKKKKKQNPQTSNQTKEHLDDEMTVLSLNFYMSHKNGRKHIFPFMQLNSFIPKCIKYE